MTMKQRVGIQYQVNKNIKSNLVNQGKVLLAANMMSRNPNLKETYRIFLSGKKSIISGK